MPSPDEGVAPVSTNFGIDSAGAPAMFCPAADPMDTWEDEDLPFRVFCSQSFRSRTPCKAHPDFFP